MIDRNITKIQLKKNQTKYADFIKIYPIFLFFFFLIIYSSSN